MHYSVICRSCKGSYDGESRTPPQICGACGSEKINTGIMEPDEVAGINAQFLSLADRFESQILALSCCNEKCKEGNGDENGNPCAVCLLQNQFSEAAAAARPIDRKRSKDDDFRMVCCIFCKRTIGHFAAISRRDLLQVRCRCERIVEIIGTTLFATNQGDVAWANEPPDGL
jgi:hypothetical protein